MSLIPQQTQTDPSLCLFNLICAQLAQKGCALRGATIVLLGYECPQRLIARLLLKGALVRIHDPWIPAYQGNFYKVVEGADILIILVGHDAYRNLPWPAIAGRMHHLILIDTQASILPQSAQRAGFHVEAPL